MSFRLFEAFGFFSFFLIPNASVLLYGRQSTRKILERPAILHATAEHFLHEPAQCIATLLRPG